MYEAEDLFSGFRPEPTPSTHPDMRMEVYGAIHDDGDVFIIHDRPFQEELSWVEYDKIDSRIDFIMNDGDLRNFGITVPSDFGKKLKQLHTISVILMQDSVAISGEDYPLIIHS